MLDAIFNWLTTEIIFGLQAGLFLFICFFIIYPDAKARQVKKRIEQETRGMAKEEAERRIKEIAEEGIVKSPAINKIVKVCAICLVVLLLFCLVLATLFSSGTL